MDQWSAHGSTGDHNLFLLFSCHKHSAGTKSPHHRHLPPSSNFPFPLITVALWFSPCSPFRNRAVLIISARSWFTSPSPLPLSIMLVFQQVPPLTNTPSLPPSQLLSPHPPISLHQGWLLPLQTHLSMHLFLILSLSSHHTVASVFLNPSRPWKTDSRRGADTIRGWSGGGGGVVCTAKPFCSTAISKRGHRRCCCIDQEDWKSPPTCDLLDTGDKNSPSPWRPSYQKDTLFFSTCQSVKKFLCCHPSIGEKYHRYRVKLSIGFNQPPIQWCRSLFASKMLNNFSNFSIPSVFQPCHFVVIWISWWAVLSRTGMMSQ